MARRYYDAVIPLTLLFLGVLGSSKSKGNGGPPALPGGDSGDGAASSRGRPAKAANATPTAARRTAAAPPLSAADDALQQAALDAVIKQAVKDHVIAIETTPESAAQKQHLIQDGHAIAEPAGPTPNPPPGASVNELAVPASMLSPPSTAIAPGASPAAKTAALQLMTFLLATRRFGSTKDKPAEIRAAQKALGVTADGIVGPKTRAASAAVGVELPRSPHDAAASLRAMMLTTSGPTRAQVTAAQSDLGVEPDGIVGPKTRAAARAAGTTLPLPKKG